MASVSLTDALYDVDQVGVFEHYTPQWVAEDKLPQQEGRSERHVRLAQAVERLGLAPGETRPLSALKEKLAAATGLSQAWLYANLAMALPERGTADADGGEYNWSKDATKKTAPILIHRTPGPVDDPHDDDGRDS